VSPRLTSRVRQLSARFRPVAEGRACRFSNLREDLSEGRVMARVALFNT